MLVAQEQERSEAVSVKQRRIGLLCQQLRAIGIDATPQMPTWTELISHYSDSQILAAAESARHAKPEERIHLNYLIPKLSDVARSKNLKKINARQPPKAENFDKLDYGIGGKL